MYARCGQASRSRYRCARHFQNSKQYARLQTRPFREELNIVALSLVAATAASAVEPAPRDPAQYPDKSFCDISRMPFFVSLFIYLFYFGPRFFFCFFFLMFFRRLPAASITLPPVIPRGRAEKICPPGTDGGLRGVIVILVAAALHASIFSRCGRIGGSCYTSTPRQRGAVVRVTRSLFSIITRI